MNALEILQTFTPRQREWLDSKKALYHLLIKGEFKVWCLPNRSPANLNVTNKLSKTTCATCLTNYRIANGGRKAPFKKKHTEPGVFE